MFYEIINPSDKAFFKAESLHIACLVTVLLGSGKYSANPEIEGAPSVPFFMFGGIDKWWAENGDGGDLDGAVERNKRDLAKALRSVCYGSITDRKMFDLALAAIDDPQKREAFIEQWNDTHRSSLNNIMGRAHAYAEKFERSL